MKKKNNQKQIEILYHGKDTLCQKDFHIMLVKIPNELFFKTTKNWKDKKQSD